MKKIMLLAAVLLGTAAASQAGVDVHVSLPLPPLPGIVIGHRAPVCPPPVYYHAPAPVYYEPAHCPPPPPRYCAPAPVYVAPAPVVVVKHPHWKRHYRYGHY